MTRDRNTEFKLDITPNWPASILLALACLGFIVTAYFTEGGPWGDLAWVAGVFAVLLGLEVHIHAGGDDA